MLLIKQIARDRVFDTISILYICLLNNINDYCIHFYTLEFFLPKINFLNTYLHIKKFYFPIFNNLNRVMYNYCFTRFILPSILKYMFEFHWNNILLLGNKIYSAYFTILNLNYIDQHIPNFHRNIFLVQNILICTFSLNWTI